MFCPNCGSQNPEGTIFCASCGTKVAAQQNAAPTYAPNQPPMYEAPTYTAPQTPAYEAPVYTAPPAYDPPAEKPAKKKFPLIPIIIGLIAVIAVVIAAILLFGGEKYAILEESVTYDADGKEISSISVEVNKKGLPVSGTYTSGKNEESFEAEYDKKGNVTKVTMFDKKGNETGSTEYEYDKKGNMTAEINYNKDGEETSRTEYEYDKKDNMTAEYDYNSDGEETWCTEYEYDKKGNVITETNYRKGEKYSCYEYEYDKHDEVISMEYTDYEDDEYSYSYTYEIEYKGDKKIKEVRFKDGEETGSTEYEYKGKNVTSLTNYDEKGKETSCYEYEYKNGNVVKMSYYYEGDLEEYTEYTWAKGAKKLTDAQVDIFGSYGIISEKP